MYCLHMSNMHEREKEKRKWLTSKNYIQRCLKHGILIQVSTKNLYMKESDSVALDSLSEGSLMGNVYGIQYFSMNEYNISFK